MAKYNITYECGHDGVIVIYGTTKSREWQVERHEERICAECFEEKRIEQNELAAKQNLDSGMPTLTGTEKQVVWAEKIRADKMAIIEKLDSMPRHELNTWWSGYDLKGIFSEVEIAEMKEKCGDKNEMEFIMQTTQMQVGVAALAAQTRAHWWIDNRDSKLSYLIAQLIASLPIVQPLENKALELEAQIEATVRPENPSTETVAEIKILDNRVVVDFPEKVEKFRLLMRKHNFKWNDPVWARNIVSSNGTSQDRAAEIAHELLGNEIIIRIYDEDLRIKAIAGTFEKEQTSWVRVYTEGTNVGRLCISWAYEDDFYKAAKRISTAKYVKPDISVAAAQFEQVLDFAELNGFSISDKAMELIENAREAKARALTTSVKIIKKIKKNCKNKPEKLTVPVVVEVDAELMD